MPKVGDKISFVPCCFMRPSGQFGKAAYPVKVNATIDYVNEAHRWFRAEFKAFGVVMHECFKF